MRRTNPPRTAFSLVELIAATAMMATLTTTSVVLLRSAQNAWKQHRDELTVRNSATAVLRHVARKVRQSLRVVDVTAETTTSGTLTLLAADGSLMYYGHNSSTKQALYGTTSASNLLASNIKTLQFGGLKANGSTLTTQTDLVHAVRCTVTYDLTRPSGTTTETLSCIAWLRSW